MRGALTGILGVIYSVFLFIIALVIGTKTDSAITGIVVIIVGILLTIPLHRWCNRFGRIDMSYWLSTVEKCKYKYAWDGNGIAVSPESRSLFLTTQIKDSVVRKSYNFSDVREWGYNIVTTASKTQENIDGTRGILGAISSCSHAVGRNVTESIAFEHAQKQTGLWIKVADVEYPIWFVPFEFGKDMKVQILRWMEILQQCVNEDRGR